MIDQSDQLAELIADFAGTRDGVHIAALDLTP
jgi:hypothetical protein